MKKARPKLHERSAIRGNDVYDTGRCMIEVVAALIWDENRFLICQRPEHKARPLLWEFPGGKVEPGESLEDALSRECKEELDIALAVGSPFCDVTHEYADVTIHLSVMNAVIIKGSPQLIEHNDLRWIRIEDLQQFTFCPADDAITRFFHSNKDGLRCHAEASN